ncbi:TetR/AcrR family transcriptional regulator [Aciditerrimonas ferrireducens]|uniref:TetR/AcrR family transcriptional regulator n=1 Tax=Aciditerrimonas ferrireducens TaxID=667306 RepID=A0ABV6C7I6_9ACTN
MRGRRAAGRWASAVEAHRAAQRDVVLDAALELLRERGLAGLTMSALADRAGVSRATLYHYFPDVDHVLAAWVSREVERSVADVLATASAIEDPVERLRWVVGDQLARFASQEHRVSVEHLDSEAGSPVVRAAVASGLEPLRQLLATTLEEAAGRGQLALPTGPDLAVDLLLGLLGATRRHLVEGRLEPAEATQVIWDLLETGWRRPGRRNPRRRPSDRPGGPPQGVPPAASPPSSR